MSPQQHVSNFVHRGAERVRGLSSSGLKPTKQTFLAVFFQTIRVAVYLAILVCTIICLAIAAHFQSILVSSELTRFVPFAIFVSAVGTLVISALLICTLFRSRNPISTRFELASLGLLAVLWLSLGGFLAASASAEADVECFSSDSSSEDPVEDPAFTTDMYHAQYRVLEAFSLINLVLVFAFLILLIFLALKQHRAGYRKVWLYPVPVYPWFQAKKYGANQTSMRSNKELPKPVTAKDAAGSRRLPSTRRPAKDGVAAAAAVAGKPEKRRSNFWVWVERPRLAHTKDRNYDRERDRAAERERERAAERERERASAAAERERERQLQRERAQTQRERERDRARDRTTTRDAPVPSSSRPRAANVRRSKTDPLPPASTERKREPLRRPTNELGSRRTVGDAPYTSTRR